MRKKKNKETTLGTAQKKKKNRKSVYHLSVKDYLINFNFD